MIFCENFYRLCVVLVLLAVNVATAEEAAESKDPADTSAEGPVQVDTTGLKSGCFYPRDVRDFEALNRQYLIVYAPNERRAFLLFIAPPSVELRNAITIGFVGRDRICGRVGDRLVLEGGLPLGRDASILNVWRLDEAAAARMLENKRAREKPTVEPAAESPGAEVETEIKPDEAQPQEDPN